MNINRRDFLKLAGAAAAVPLAGMSSEADISGLPDKWAQKFQSCKMDEYDKAILENIILSERTKDRYLEVFEACLSHPLWKKIDQPFKESIVNAAKNKKLHLSNNGKVIAIRTSDMYLRIAPDSFASASFLTIKQEYVYGWFERSERTQDYIKLSDILLKQLSPEDRSWANKLIFVVNDNLHPLLTAPYAVPTRQEFANGSINGKAMCSVGGIFPTRCDLSISKEQAADLWNRNINALDRILIKRNIPQEMRDMYHKVGYVYVLSDLNGEETVTDVSGNCTRKMLCNGGPINFLGICTDVFTNPVTPLLSNARASIKDVEPSQKERRKNARKNLQATLSDLSREKDLSADRKKVLDAVLSQLYQVREPQQAALVAQKRTAISNADFAHTRGGDE